MRKQAIRACKEGKGGMEATRNAEMTRIEAISETEHYSLRRQLGTAIEQVTWGGARQFAAKLAPFGLTLQQYFTLVAVNQMGGCTMSALAAQTHHSFGTMTGIVDRLVRQELVARKSHATDRRVVLVQLTDNGTEILAHIEEMREGQFNAVLQQMGELQAHNLVRLVAQYLSASGINNPETAGTTNAFA